MTDSGRQGAALGDSQRRERSAGGAAALVLHTERSDTRAVPEGCERPRRGLRWQHEDGSLRPVRCGSPNLCRYCSWLTALENAYVVRIDAEMCCPRIGFTLTTKAAVTPPVTFRQDVAYVFKVLRREPWAREARYLGQIEFTTGSGENSGGARRIHQHGLLKDVDSARASDCGELMQQVWSRVTGAHRVEAHELWRPGRRDGLPRQPPPKAGADTAAQLVRKAPTPVQGLLRDPRAATPRASEPRSDTHQDPAAPGRRSYSSTVDVG